MDQNTKISDMTLGELVEVLGTMLNVALKSPAPDTVSGLAGIAQIFGVSTSTAKRIKASGIIDQAISQRGRTIVTDVKLARELYHRSTHGRSRIGFSKNR